MTTHRGERAATVQTVPLPPPVMGLEPTGGGPVVDAGQAALHLIRRGRAPWGDGALT